MEFVTKAFNELTVPELYELLALRQEVFVVEQDCPYLDADGKDQNSLHVMGYLEGKIKALARIPLPNISYPEVALGRVITAQDVRRAGYGKKLMEECHREIEKRLGNVPIRISAQQYLKKFYGDLGYLPTGKEYLEDGIPHLEMLRPSTS